MEKANRAETIRNVLGAITAIAGNRQPNQIAVQPVQPPKEKTDYTPFIIAGAFTIISALIISRGR